MVARGVPGSGDVTEDVEELRQSATSAWDSFVDALPRLGVALAALALLVLAGRILRPFLERRLRRRRTPSFARVMSRLAAAGLAVVGVLSALAIAFPSVEVVDVLAGAGVLSIALGFALQDILQNLVAGLLLLFRQPFRGGDQITVGDVSGTVVEINVRETVVITFDGHTVLIPNATVYTDVIDVQTTTPVVRDEVRVGVAYSTDLERAQQVIERAVADVEAVSDEPPPEVLVVGFAASAIDLDVLFWSDAHQLDSRRARSDAVKSIARALDAEGIEIPYDIVTVHGPT